MKTRQSRDQKQDQNQIVLQQNNIAPVLTTVNRKRKIDQITLNAVPVTDPVKIVQKHRKLNQNIVAAQAVDLNKDNKNTDQKPKIQSQKMLIKTKSQKSKEEKKSIVEESKVKLEDMKQNNDMDLYKNVSKFFKPKPFTDHNATNCAKTSKYIEVTIQELLDKVKDEEKNNNRKAGEDENCAICMCELYENLEKMSELELQEINEKQMKQEMPIDIVLMSKCTDHCFHRECLEAQMGTQECIKCAVCSQIYGVLTGAMPTGTMDWKLNPKSKSYYCEGYEGMGVWEIRYNFPDGKINGVKYKGTRRNAYLPDTPEGREVLALLVKSFERKLSFLVGSSVTTGQNNVVVWNVHHKTNTHGGSSSFGYPDPTYFNRVKNELSDRGVVLESLTEVEKITNKIIGSRFV